MMVLIPNLLWLLFPPTNAPAVEEVDEPVGLMILERAGQFGVTIIPLFYPVILDDAASSFYLIAMLLLLIVYYAGWFRFFQRGRNYSLLFLPLWRIPIPMAVSPVLYFVLSAGLLKSFPMFLAALLLASGHLAISYREYRRIIRFLS
nr:hypothetical protein [Sporomusa silvacetica]